MAKFYGRGTGANRGYWELQWRDGKGRWIEMGSIGRYIMDGITYTGRMVGGDSEDSINMERRTANGKIVEGVIDKISPKDFENLNVKALLDAPEGFSEEEVAQARRAENTRPIAASFPNGTKLKIDGAEHTKTDADTWTDPEGNPENNSAIDSRMEEASASSAEIPEEAELTAENILNATDGSSLTWNSKQYSRLDGEWFDGKTGKPVSDKTMRTKTDGDLATDGGEESFTPTPASEYETGTKLHAEMGEGASTADLEKTDDNEWDITTDSNDQPTSTDDSTVDNVIEAADTLDDFLLNPEESEPVSPTPASPGQLEDELEAAHQAWIDLDLPKTDDDDRILPLTDDERAELERIRGDFERIAEDVDRLEDPEDVRYAQGVKENAQTSVDDINGALTDDGEEEFPDTETTPEFETETGQSIPDRLNSLDKEIDNLDNGADVTDDDAGVLNEIDRELADIEEHLESTDDPSPEAQASLQKANDQRAKIQAIHDARVIPADDYDDRQDDEDTAPEAEDSPQFKGPQYAERLRQDRESEAEAPAESEPEALPEYTSPRGRLSNRAEMNRRLDAVNSELDALEVKIDNEGLTPEDRERVDVLEAELAEVEKDTDSLPEGNSRSERITENKKTVAATKAETLRELYEEDQSSEDSTPTPEPEEELPEEDVDTSGYDPDAEDEDVDWDSEVNPLDAEPTPEEEDAPETTTRPVDEVLGDLQDDGAYAMEQVAKAASGDSTADLDEADSRLRARAVELSEALEGATPSERRRIDASSRQLRQAQEAVANARGTQGDQEWDDVEDQDGISEVKHAEFRDGAVAMVFKDDESGRYGASAFPPASDTNVAGGEQFDTPEQAQQYARRELAAHDPVAANTPETHSEDDLSNGHQADPQPVDEAASTPDVEQVKQANQDAAESGTFDITEVDAGADFTETSDITERRENAAKLVSPEPGDTVVTVSGRTQVYVGGGIWETVDAPAKQETSNEAQKKLNKASPEPIRVGSAGEPEPEAPVAAPTNKHGINLKNGPHLIRATLADGTEVTFEKTVNGWHRRMDNEGNLAKSPIKRDRLNDFLNNADQVSSVEPAHTVKRPKVKDTPAPDAPQAPKEQGLTEGKKTKHKASGSEDRTPLGSDVIDKITKGEPGTLLTQNGARVGYVGPDGTPYYVGDRIIYQDRSKRTRSVRIAAIGSQDKNGNYRLDTIPDEHDILASENKMPYDTWRSLSDEDRVAEGMDAARYSKVASVMTNKFAQNKVRSAQDENKEDVHAEHQRRKEEGKVTGVNVGIPEFLPEEEASRDRVYRDESTRIIGTLNKHGELFKAGEVVTYGPNNEVGTIVRVGEADDVIRIAPNGQSSLEAQHFHVDTIAHSDKPATYYDENYDVPANERVIYDRFNDPVRVGDTIYRYGLPFTVKDIFPDGRKMRVVGQDWAGEQGSTPAVQFSKLIDMGMDEDLAKKISSESDHDFMPEHLQIFTGDVNDIRSIRTHDSHMWTMVRDDQGNVIESHPENRAAAQTRATGNRNDQKTLNAQWARDMAERPDDEVRLEYNDIQPGQFIDQVFGQAVSDNYSHYIDVTFGTDMVIPDNSRLVGQDRFGNPEFYIKKDNRWRIEGIDDDEYEMSASEFGRYRMRSGFDPGKDFEGDVTQRNKGLVYMGDADEEIAPKPGQRLSKKDAPTFKLMPVGSVVRFEDADGNMITIRKGPDGEWYKTTQSGAWAGNAKPVDFSKIPGKGTYRGPYNRQAPLPAESDRSSEEYEKNNVQRQKLRQERNVTRRGKGGEDRIYGSHITGEGTYRDNRENSDNVRDSREANAQLAEDNERLAEEAQAAQEQADRESEARLLLEEQMREMQEEMRRLRGETGDDGAVTASGNRIIATRKGTDNVLAVYNRVDGNVWEYTSAKGHRREFTMENVPSTPGVTYKVEEKTA